MPNGIYNKISRVFGYFDRVFRTAACVGIGNAWRIHVASRMFKQGRLALNGHSFYFRGIADKGVLSHFYQPMFYIDDAQQITSIIDLGAHIGDETFKFAMRYPKSKILAVEPSPANFQYLARNTKGLASVTTVQAAVGATEKKAWLVLRDGEIHESYYVAETQDLPANISRVAEVDVLGVDTLMKRHGFETVDLVKIDIEGMEDVIFLQNNDWIDRVNAIVVETRNPKIVAQMCRSGFDTFHSGENFVFIRSGLSWRLQDRVGYL